MENNKPEVSVTHILMILAISCLGGLVILLGLLSMFNDAFASGVLFVIFGTLIFPPCKRFYRDYLNITPKTKLVLTLLSIVLAIASIPTNDKQDAKQQPIVKATIMPVEPPISSIDTKPSMPESELHLIALVEKYAILYDQAQNELQKSKLLTDRAREVENLNITTINWIGTIDSMGTNMDGKAYVVIKINDRISIKTFSNAFSDIGYDTLIPQNSSMYGILSKLKTGDPVKFSVALLTVINITEHGKMTSPEFIGKFISIEPIR